MKKVLNCVKCLPLFHYSYFIKQLPNGFPCRIVWSMQLGCCLTFRNAKIFFSYAFRKSRKILRALITLSCKKNHSVILHLLPQIVLSRFQAITIIVYVRVVRKVNSVIHRIVIFSNFLNIFGNW